MSVPRRLPSVALLLAALAALLATAVVPAHARTGHHHRTTTEPRAHTVFGAFTQRRAHGRRGLTVRPRKRVPARRPGPAPSPAAPALPLGGLVSPLLPAVTLPVAPAPTAPTGADPAAPPPVVSPVPDVPGDPVPAPAISTLGVQTLDTPDYRMLLSRPSVTAGIVRLQLRNGGEDPHNLLLTRTDGTGDAIAVALTAPGATRTTSVELAPGRYRLLCTLTAPVVHDSAGMHATLDVTIAP